MIDGEGTPADAIDLTPVEAIENYNYGMVATVRLRTTARLIFVTLLPNLPTRTTLYIEAIESAPFWTAEGFGDWGQL